MIVGIGMSLRLIHMFIQDNMFLFHLDMDSSPVKFDRWRLSHHDIEEKCEKAILLIILITEKFNCY